MPRAKSTPQPTGPAGPAIAGIGASAGGLEAFSALLHGLPPKPGLAIVFVQHLAPQHDSALVALLSGLSALPVLQATQGMKVEANHVYVIPPNTQMAIVGRALQLSARPGGRSRYTPVDTFLSSLAEAMGPRAIGVILSGSASDGALGMRDIKGAGGVTIAQVPSTAKYDGMPRASIATGMVDLVLAPAEIGTKLAELSQHVYARVAGRTPAELPVSDEQIREIFTILRPVSGVDFSHYKLPTIKRRLYRRMSLHRLDDVSQYVRLLRTDAAEARSLYQDLLIHVTRFFREPESFDALTRKVLPAIAAAKAPAQPIRAWVSGCSTGEEAYSLAIVLVEFLQKQNLDVPVHIFATDLSETAVEHARAGVFGQSIEHDVTPERLRRFFTKQDGGYRVAKSIRDLCVFARQDLTKDPPFSRLDLILCRNVLIYMDTVLQKKLLSVFYYALNPHGFLVLGQAETTGAQAGLFSLVDKKFRVHSKSTSAPPPAVAFAFDRGGGVTPPLPAPAEAPAIEKFLQTEVSRIIIDHFAPPGVVVDSDLQIVQFRGQTGPFLEPAPGEASLNLLKMAKEGLLYGLRTALRTARQTRRAVHKDGLQLRAGKGWKPVSIDVIPMPATGRLHFLVLFDDRQTLSTSRGKPAEPPPRLGKRERQSQIDFLQRELNASREYLQSIIQEVEAANEELQSANEEILSSNEELQSTNEELDTAKEELQSTNEELNTVNEELQGRNEELSRVNSDLINLLGSVQIAIVIVSADLRIRRFTPTAERVLNLIPADADRLIGHINPNIVGANLEHLITECIDTIAPVEREVQDREGHWYSLRIRPYRSVDNKIDGAVLTLYDIDAPKRYAESIRSAAEMADALLQSSSQPMALLDSELRLRSASPQFVDLLSLPGGERWQRRPLADFTGGGAGLEQLRALAQAEHAAIDETALALRLPAAAEDLPFTARAFRHVDSPSGRVVLLTAGTSGAART